MREMRLDMRLTQREYADMIGITVNRYGNFEYARTVLPADVFMEAVRVYDKWSSDGMRNL